MKKNEFIENYLKINEEIIHVNLINYSSIASVIIAARTCYDSLDEDLNKFYNENKEVLKNEKDKELLKKILSKGHESVIEHVYYTFKIHNVSRLFLQQLVRHRIASYSVESTRYTLNKHFKNVIKFDYIFDYNNDKKVLNILNKFIVITGNKTIDNCNVDQLNRILQLLRENYPQDLIKYMIPESFKTEIVWTINARSLRNFLKLRTNKKAHIEIRTVAKEILSILPKEHKELLFFDI